MWTLYDYQNGKKRNLFKEWTEGLELKQIIELNEKLLSLRLNGMGLLPKLLASAGRKHILKMRFSAQGVQLRPLLCEGPSRDKNKRYNKEFTLLCGAIEKQWDLDPANALDKAEGYRQDVIDNLGKPDPRRVLHEKVVSKSKKRN